MPHVGMIKAEKAVRFLYGLWTMQINMGLSPIQGRTDKYALSMNMNQYFFCSALTD
jgi:hypothetical protein